jgi:ribosomal protein S19
MEVNLEQLKKNFIIIKEIRNKVTNLFHILGEHLSKLKQTYTEFIKINKDNLFVFGLDSFQFQSKIIDIEFDDMKRLFLAINNRMYCEYYKLYKIIFDYIKENINDRKSLDIFKVVNSFPVYKDLEPFKQYNFDTIQEIHDNIILLLYGINEFVSIKENELHSHQKKQSIGLNINNFVNTFNYNILMVKEKGILFISYIEFFHSLHTKHLQRFAMKMNLMYNQLIHDIRFEDAEENSNDKKKDLINKYQDDNIDKELLKEIKLSVDDNTSNLSQDSSEVSNLNSPIQSPHSKSFDFESDNLTEVTNNFFNNTKEENNTPSVKKSMTSILKKNVKKVVNSLGLFKNNKKIEDKGAKLSSDDLFNKNSINKTDIMNIDIYNSDLDDKFSNKSNNSNQKDNDTIISQGSDKIEKTKSVDEIFLELSNQCDNIIKISEKNNNIHEESITSFIEIYNNNEFVETEITNNPIIETEITNNPIIETEITNNPIIETEITNNIETEITNNPIIETEITNNIETEITNNPIIETEITNNPIIETEITNNIETEITNNLVSESDENLEHHSIIEDNDTELEETELVINEPDEIHTEIKLETEIINKKKKKKSKQKKK